MRRIICLAFAAVTIVQLSACNTVQGVGRDIESVGRAGKDVMH
ncbi:putative small secreted protein [Sphingobium fontiphilum]|uniref:Putative small secreted protein n=1 Tax=Sphingobium fontiphilum TaxID=944425 RepID=A0A7W6DE31_9SPHN|nr:entericidin A/B family lipoprotein [Sphingobium fontiphilum]MBB3981576.1 putative small secreted protein [Sphingobium fontiphilum]